MITIRRDTILKKGDKIVDTKTNKEWEVKEIKGFMFRLQSGGEEQIMNKYDLIIHPDLKLKIGDGRGYF